MIMTVVYKVLNLLLQISDYIFVFGVSQGRGDAHDSSVGEGQTILGSNFLLLGNKKSEM